MILDYVLLRGPELRESYIVVTEKVKTLARPINAVSLPRDNRNS